jgi:hypothetical protein
MSTRSLIASLTLLLTSLSLSACSRRQDDSEPARKTTETPMTTTPSAEPSSATPSAQPSSPTPGAQPSSPSATTPGMVRMTEIECTPAGTGKSATPMTLTAPEGATCTETASGLMVRAGDSFHMVIREHATKKGEKGASTADLSARKKEIEGDTSRRFGRYVTEQPDLLVWEADDGSGKTVYHFVAMKQVGDRVIMCEDEAGRSYTREQAENMSQACQSIMAGRSGTQGTGTGTQGTGTGTQGTGTGTQGTGTGTQGTGTQPPATTPPSSPTSPTQPTQPTPTPPTTPR